MRFTRIAALSATVGVVGFAGAVGTAGLANAAAQEPVAPSSYGYVLGGQGDIVGQVLSTKYVSAASPRPPASDPAATAPTNALAGNKEFNIGSGTFLKVDGNLALLKVATTADPATGVSTAKVSGGSATLDAKAELGGIISALPVVGPVLRTAAEFVGFNTKADVSLSLTALDASCQAGPSGAKPTAAATGVKATLTVTLPGVGKVLDRAPIDLESPLNLEANGKPFSVKKNTVTQLDGGGISVDAVSAGFGSERVNLGHVECRPGTPAADAQ